MIKNLPAPYPALASETSDLNDGLAGYSAFRISA
jgi:hypothetical protein